MSTSAYPEQSERLQRALSQHNIPGLDALRALAIVMVILYHLALHVVSGPMAVVVFFVLSGFLITSLLLKEVRRTQTISLHNFYRRRAYRIFPAFYVCWLVTVLILWLEHQALPWKRLGLAFFYMADYGRAFLPESQQLRFPMGISWSLAIEEKFYLLWPLALLFILRSKRPARPARTTAMVIGILWLWRVILVYAVHISAGYVYNAFDTRVDALLVGCLLAQLLQNRRSYPRFLLATLSKKWMVAVPLLIVGGIGFFEQFAGGAPLTEFTLMPLVAAVLLLQLVYWGSLGWAWLEHPAIKMMARLSYSLYLYHPIAIELVNRLPIQHFRAVLSILLFFSMSFASYFLIEKPFLRLRDHGRTGSVLLDDGRTAPSSESLTSTPSRTARESA